MPSGGGEIIIIALTSAEGLPARKALSGLVSLQGTPASPRGLDCAFGVGSGDLGPLEGAG